MHAECQLLYNPVEENVGPGSIAEIVNTPIYQQARVQPKAAERMTLAIKPSLTPAILGAARDAKERLQKQSVSRTLAKRKRPARFVYSIGQRKGL
jgi:hypothetical protein